MSEKAMTKAEAHELANTAGTPVSSLLNELVDRTFRQAKPKKAGKKKAGQESTEKSPTGEGQK